DRRTDECRIHASGGGCARRQRRQVNEANAGASCRSCRASFGADEAHVALDIPAGRRRYVIKSVVFLIVAEANVVFAKSVKEQVGIGSPELSFGPVRTVVNRFSLTV